jgi:uncharacterized protein (TIGR00661 family)
MRILYGVVGEGMGHATRSKVVIEHLRERGHKVKVVVSGRAYHFLKQHFDDVVEIRGLTIQYDGNTVDRDGSLLKNVVVAPGLLLANAKAYFQYVAPFRPHLCVSDFDSFAYLFGKRHGLPVLSIDNQQIIHKCRHDDDIKKGIKADFQATRAFVKAKLPGCDHYVVTTFFYPKVREKFEGKVTLVPPILREAVLRARPSRGAHVLVYQTSTSDVSLLPALNRLRDQSFVVYGLRRNEVVGNATLKDFDEAGFVDDLASARAVVSNGGLTLLSEALYLGKPVFSVPVRHQFEQEMNARYIEKLGYGLASPKMDADALGAFLREEYSFARRVQEHRQAGNELLFQTLDRLLKNLGK